MNNIFSIVNSYNTYSGPHCRKKYITILKEVFEELSYAIIREKYELSITGLGKIYIRRIKVSDVVPDKRKVDFTYYNKTKKIKTFDNIHTDGFYFKFYWKRPIGWAQFYNSRFYKFRPIRGKNGSIGKRGLASWIKECSINPHLKDYTTR